MSESNIKCTRCGSAEHAVIDCYAAQDISGNTIPKEEEEKDDNDELYREHCYEPFTTVLECSVHEKKCKARDVEHHATKKMSVKRDINCYHCGSTGHYPKNCQIAKHFDKD